MVAPDQNNSQQHINGANGVNGAGDDDRRPPQPSASGEGADEPLPSVQSLCLRGLALGPRMLRWLARRAGAQWLPFPVLDAIYCTLTAVSRYTSAADAQARQPQSEKWYMVKPISAFLRITTAGVHIVERYLDNRLPENQYLRNWLRSVCATLKASEEDASGSDSDEDPAQLPELEPSPSSSASSLSADEEHPSEEEPAQPDTPGDCSMYLSVEQLNEQEEATEAAIKDDKREKTEETEEKSEEKVEEGKVERPATAAEEAGGAAASTEQPQPEPQPQPPAAAPAECLVSAQEAEQAAMGAPRTPAAQPSSQDFLAAERPSQPPPVPSRPARRPDKGALFLNLFGAKK